MLTELEQHQALDLAVGSISGVLRTGRLRLPQPDELSIGLQQRLASFVTLKEGRVLRGCIGALVAREPLGVDIARHAAAAAFEDPRFQPVEAAEVPLLHVEISVLSIPEQLPVRSYKELLDAVRPGVDGITVEAGYNRATLLPAVWADLPDPLHFLDALWQKAGLSMRDWRDGIKVSRYTAIEFGGDARDHLAAQSAVG